MDEKSIIQGFKLMDSMEQELAYQQWILRKNLETTHQMPLKCKKTTIIDPSLNSLSEEEIDQLIIKLSKINVRYDEWKKFKNLKYNEERKIAKERARLEKEKQQLESELKRARKEKSNAVFEEWKLKKLQTKDVNEKKRAEQLLKDAELTKQRNQKSQKKVLEWKNELKKRIKVPSFENKPWIPIIDPPISTPTKKPCDEKKPRMSVKSKKILSKPQTSLLSPPSLYQEPQKYKLLGNYSLKFKSHVASAQ